MANNVLVSPDFLTLTLGIVIYFVGVILNRRIPFLRNYNIPEPVTGGFLAAAAIWVFHALTGLQIVFEMTTRDRLLVIFFATVGVNARLSDLRVGGRTLFVLAMLTAAFVFVQNTVGILSVRMFGLPSPAGLIMGSIALVGGHGTTIAWAPAIAAEHGFPQAIEVGVAAATLGLIVASVLGGPVAKFLVDRGQLSPETGTADGRVAATDTDAAPINTTTFMQALLLVNVAVVFGYLVHGLISDMGIKLPLFVPCLLMGVALSNTVPLAFPRLKWPARTPAMTLISEYSLSAFLAMSLMSMQLWTLAGVAGPLLVVIIIQAAVVAAYVWVVLFPLLGKDYQSAVLCAGFIGLSLGATPTAIANMTAVAKHYGPSPNAFIILPLVSAFFVDLVNVFAIQLFLLL
ncbi:sodium/glutamate symporter [Mesorhizobium sp. ANAO-SY3R2]|uniref:sodium/glutamate symporter n=1 Tax=Mesorhizobium sp. ANAO-SY3R2 TaxID=3166644 RepID=UPI00367196EB